MQVTIEEIDLLRDMLGELRDKDLLSSYANDLYQILLKKVSIALLIKIPATISITINNMCLTFPILFTIGA